eukprot:Lithocolla_globosa_v1_NODE_515_length_3843_cov_39.657075.p2 type:complete len:159 gc:universal NODE_515_length_3843_cov_39.657075:1520-1044(-)
MSYSINIAIDLEDDELWPYETLEKEKAIVPILVDEKTDYVQIGVHFYTHHVELGFAITFHKVQSKTMSKITLDLNKLPSNHLGTLSFELFYVGYTRVKDSDNMRILPCHLGCNFSHLFQLAPKKELVTWLKSFTGDQQQFIRPEKLQGPPLKRRHSGN